MKSRKNRTAVIALTALIAAALCILGPISIPIPVSPVPISLATFVICLSAYVLGMKAGAASVVIYLLLGLAGLPVFTGFQGGPGKMFGPTGGYLIGYIFLALIGGLFADKTEKWYLQLVGFLIGTAVLYTFGTVWLAVQASLDLRAALFAGVIPYIPLDLVKIAAALLTGSRIRKQIKHIG